MRRNVILNSLLFILEQRAFLQVVNMCPTRRKEVNDLMVSLHGSIAMAITVYS